MSSRNTTGVDGGFGRSPAAPITMNICPYKTIQCRVPLSEFYSTGWRELTALGASFFHSVSS